MESLCTKEGGQLFFSERKDPVELPLYEQAVGQLSKKTEGGHVGHEIFHQNSIFRGRKSVFVMPQSVRPYPLFVNEEMALVHLRDLSDPIHWNAKQGLDGIRDHQPRIHGFGRCAPDLERHGRGRDLG